MNQTITFDALKSLLSQRNPCAFTAAEFKEIAALATAAEAAANLQQQAIATGGGQQAKKKAKKAGKKADKKKKAESPAMAAALAADLAKVASEAAAAVVTVSELSGACHEVTPSSFEAAAFISAHAVPT